MAIAVEAPKLGNTVEECLITKWVRRKGDAVTAGELVVEIETDKATFEVTAPVNGTVLETFLDEGALVPVFTNLFVIGEPGEDAEQFRPSAAAAGGAPPPVARLAQAPVADARPAASGATLSAPLSPRARRFSEEHRFHPPLMAGSGPGGRVLEEDLRRAYYSPAPVTRAAPIPVPSNPVPAASPRQAPVSNIRQRIAKRMRESLASTAQYTLNASAGARGLVALRARIKAAAMTPDININALVTYCTIQALLEMPELNAEYINGRIYQRPEVHMGFACDTPRGLMVPVLRDAHAMSVAGLAARMKELTAQAVQGTISPDDLAGATFTVSNLGGLGIESFTPLLNPPQVAILGVGAIELKPVRKDGGIEFADVIGLSLTCDHQVIDGAPGARFLQVLREKIENVESLCTI